MKQLNNNTFGKNYWSRHWEKLCFLKNTLGKIPGTATIEILILSLVCVCGNFKVQTYALGIFRSDCFYCDHTNKSGKSTHSFLVDISSKLNEASSPSLFTYTTVRVKTLFSSFNLETKERIGLSSLEKGVVQSGPAEWWSKKCNRLRPQVKKRLPNFNQ